MLRRILQRVSIRLLGSNPYCAAIEALRDAQVCVGYMQNSDLTHLEHINGLLEEAYDELNVR